MKTLISTGVIVTGIVTQIAIVSNYYNYVEIENQKGRYIELREQQKIRRHRNKEDIELKEIAIKHYKKLKYEQEEKERMKNYTYRKIKDLRTQTGLNVVGFEEYTFELSFYTDLNCENGYGKLTANGETLSNGMIANNFLPFGTKIYFEGFGTKRVTDRGSKKYFYSVNKADVFVPRNGNESDGEYLSRINNMGRKQVKGYILKVGKKEIENESN